MEKNDTISGALKSLFQCNFTANDYEPQDVCDYLSSIKDRDIPVLMKAELREIIDKRLWSQRFYLGLTGFEFKSEDDFYTYLEEVFQYVFNDGPLPDIEKYWY